MTTGVSERTSARVLLEDESRAAPAARTATVKRAPRGSPIWIVPIVAALVAGFLLYEHFIARGPVVAITFRTADGLTPGETEVRHKAVPLGKVEDIELAPDMMSVVVHVRIDAHAKSILTDHARFWVVRPRLSASNLSGLETLVSGAYIEVDPGAPGGRREKSFRGLDEPPGVRSDDPGTTYVLEASRLRGLAPGAPVYFRDKNVGELLTADLAQGDGPLTLRVFVRKPFDDLVKPETRFWNVSGVFMDMSPEGMQIQLESLQSLLAGGIAFETPRRTSSDPAAQGSSFRLYDNKGQADTELYGARLPCVTYLRASIAGLGRGSAVALFGVQVGMVTDVRLVADDRAPGRVRARIAFDVQPERLSFGDAAAPDDTLAPLVHDGMRAVLESASFITGQQMIALEYAPSAKPGSVTQEGDALVLPGDEGGLESLKSAATAIAQKLSRIPFDEIGSNLNATVAAAKRTVGGPELAQALVNLNETMRDVQALAKDANAGLKPALEKLPSIAAQLEGAVQKANAAFGASGYGAGSDFSNNVDRLIRQVGEAARTIRLLADYLDRHPESLIRGRSDGK